MTVYKNRAQKMPFVHSDCYQRVLKPVLILIHRLVTYHWIRLLNRYRSVTAMAFMQMSEVSNTTMAAAAAL